MSSALWLASFLAFPAAGAPLLLHGGFARYGAAARFVLAGAAGVVAISWTMTASALAGWKWNLPLLVLAGAAECLALRAALGGASGVPAPVPPARERMGTLEWIAAGVCAFSVLVSAAAALSASATSPDLFLFWGSKAQAFASARTIDDTFLGEPFLRFLHTSYPPLVTNAYAFATIAAGRLPWMAAVASFPLLLGALAAALPSILRVCVSRRDALVATAFITASLAVAGDALDIAGNADMALLLFEILAVAVLLGVNAESGPAQLLGGLLFAGAAAAKVEGLPFVIAAGGLLLALARRPTRRLFGAAARTLLPAVLSLGVWFAYGRKYFLFRGYESYGPTFEVHLPRLGLVLAEIMRSFWHTGAALPWLVPIAALVLTARRSTLRFSAYPLGIAVALSFFFVFTYLHGSLDPTLWITWSAGRIFLVTVPLLVLAVTALRANAGPENASGEARPRARAT
ncbi:MAG TPA: hypothetical protein VIZ58_10405 [Thermoanaerobaculia bacterium]